MFADFCGFTNFLPRIQLTGTKENIKSGKTWILDRTQHNGEIASLLEKHSTDPQGGFERKLFIIYLINDVLHHRFVSRACIGSRLAALYICIRATFCRHAHLFRFGCSQKAPSGDLIISAVHKRLPSIMSAAYQLANESQQAKLMKVCILVKDQTKRC